MKIDLRTYHKEWVAKSKSENAYYEVFGLYSLSLMLVGEYSIISNVCK